MEQAFYAEYAQAEQDHWWFAARQRIIESVLRANLRGSASDRSLLEIGTGTGRLGQMLSRHGWFVGSELNASALAYARPRLDRLVGARSEQLPFRDNVFDAIFACDVLEHVPDDAAALSEMRRVCRAGGQLILTVPAFQWLWSDHDEINHHQRRYTRPGLAAALSRAGWRIDRLSYFNMLLFPPIALARLLAGRRREGPPKSDLSRPLPRPVSRFLEGIFASERGLLSRCDLPVGVSLLALASSMQSEP